MHYGIANRSGQPSPGEVVRILRTAKANGIDFIDTARSYEDSERIIGELIGNDDWWTISTKLNGELGDLSDCSPSNVACLLQAARKSLRTSREMLRLGRLPIVLLHRFDHLGACFGEIWSYLRDEQAHGMIGKLGLSAADPQEALTALDDSSVEVIQVPANLADRRLEAAGFFDRARRQGVQIIVRSVFLQGALLLQRERLPSHLMPLGQLLDALDDEARRTSATRSELIFAHARSLGQVILVGCECEAQLQANIDAWQRSSSVPDPAPAIADLATNLPRAVIEPWRWPR